MLESLMHGDSTFITLTYDDEHLPAGGNLVPKDVQNWLKRLRKATAPMRLRYYLVGEYGDTTERPHYHVALFGYPGCSYGITRFTNLASERSCCPRCDQVRSTWGKGSVLLGQLTTESAQYIAGYVTKKMTSANDERLRGRKPEFSRQSLKPGIGVPALATIAETIRNFNLYPLEGDVPSSLRHGKKILPLGRYLRRKLRVLLGKSPNATQETFDKINEEMLSVLQVSKDSPDFVSVRSLLLQKDAQKVASMESRSRIYKKRGSI